MSLTDSIEICEEVKVMGTEDRRVKVVMSSVDEEYKQGKKEEEIERLEKEKEWLLNECARQYVFEGKMKATATMEEAKKWLSDNMQQVLKEQP